MSEISDVVIKLKADASIFKTEMKAAASAASGADDAMKKMAEDAKQIFNATRTPVEKFRAEVARLNAMFKAGALDVDLYTRAQRAAAAQLAATQKQSTGMQKLKGVLGEGGLGGIASVAMGGGAVAVLGMATGAMAGLAEKGKEWAEAMRSGAMSSADVGLELSKSLPIIGDLVRTAISLADAIAPVGVDLSKQHEIAGDMVTQQKRERDLAVAGSDFERQRVAEAQRYADVKAKIAEETRAALGPGRENSIEANKAADQARRFAEETHKSKVAAIEKAEADKKAAETAEQLAKAEGKAKEAAAEKNASDKKAADEAKRSWDSIQDRIKKLGEEVKSPIEVYKDAMKELQSLKKFGLGEDVFQKQAAKLEADLLGPTKEVSMAGYQTLEQGYARIAQSAATRGGDSIASRQLDEMKKVVEATKQGTDKVVSAIEKRPDGVAKFAA